MLVDVGADRCMIMRHEPFFLGTTPTPEHCRFESGGVGKGPATWPLLHSRSNSAVMMSG